MKQRGVAQFVMAEDFLSLLTFFHVVYLEGRPGGGKTHLAVLLAAWLQARGLVERTVANFPLSFAVPVPEKLENAAIILDETWMFITNRAAVYEYGGFVRKVNAYLLMPSVYPPHRLLTRFRVARYLNLFAYGVPAWLYRWDLNRETVKEKGYFLVVHPERAFGSYDTEYIPSDDGGIVTALQSTTGRGRSVTNEREDDDSELEAALDGVAEEVEDGVRAIGREVENFKRARSRLR